MSSSSVKPIPEGMHTITPYLVCGGAAQAIEFYKKAFDALELMRMAGPGDKVMHAELKIGDSVLMLADESAECGMPGPIALKGSPVALHLYVKDADAVFAKATAAGATVKMPLTDMFWGDRYGQVQDPFGHVWSIATHVRDVSEEEIQAAKAAMLKQ
ncbi:VOC family protein [Paraburkholderia bonniea]|uniref:VOC family protein n=1 Tax=Paraburkholderia bonniea TaxID=2152891 RepID=UPI0012917B60|nr:VOC family protein [Paraburkholderia bonniea]WJF91869.1 VOC family protein [Paraburkholderia bonniea]WJF95188.1 VOC family protein [Paraburkholderia bonniea]